MAATGTGDIYTVTVVGHIFGQRTMNVYNYMLNAINVVTPLTTQFIYDQMQAAWESPQDMGFLQRACSPEQWTHAQTWVQKVSAQRIVKSVQQINLPGSRQGINEVSNLQSSITRRTEIAARSGVGGVHICMGSFDANDGLIIPSLKLALEALAQEMLLTETITVPGGGAVDMVPILWGLNKPPIPGIHFSNLQSTIVQDTVRVIRRRTVGLGI